MENHIVILRTAVGSPVAPFLLKDIRKNFNCEIIGVDIDPLACGFKFCDKSYVVSRVSESGYIEKLLELCEAHKVNVFWPDLDEELLLIAREQSRFEALGIKVILSSYSCLSICADKYKTFLFFRTNNIPAPDTVISNNYNGKEINYPFIIKPLSGRGSQNVHIIKNQKEYEFHSAQLDQFVVQELLIGREYTIDTLSDADGTFKYCSVRERISTESGISVKGKTTSKPQIEEYVARSCDLLKIKGPACFQCIEQDDGRIGFFEINPRIAGTVALSVLAGAPIITDSINTFQGKDLLMKKNFATNLYMTRYWTEEVFDLNN